MFLESSRRPSAYLLWTARILTIAFALFISIFALDVFEENRGFWFTAGALLMHLVPTFLILLIVWISWNKAWIGSVVFAVLGIAYILWAGGRFDGMVYLIIAGPLFLVALLYLLGWWQQKKEANGE